MVKVCLSLRALLPSAPPFSVIPNGVSVRLTPELETVRDSSHRPTSTNYFDYTHNTILDTVKDIPRAVMRFALRY